MSYLNILLCKITQLEQSQMLKYILFYIATYYFVVKSWFPNIFYMCRKIKNWSNDQISWYC